MTQKEELLSLIAAIVALVLLVFGCWYLLHHRSSSTVYIEDRWWNYGLSVQWRDTDTTMECSPKLDCSGIGTNRTCRSSIDCRLVTRTHTRTRCSNATTGRELPPIRPTIPCQMWSGDFLTESVTYYSAFHVTESDKSQTKTFGAALWDSLVPRSVAEITQDATGHIRTAELKK